MSLLKHSNKFWIYLAIAVVSGTALLFLTITGKRSKFDQIDKVQTNVDVILDQQEIYINNFIESGPNWCDDLQDIEKIPFPLYVYSNGALVCWNEHRIDPIFESIDKRKDLGIINIGGSQFIYSLRNPTVSNEAYYIISLLPLVQEYEISNRYLKTNYNRDIFPSHVFPREIINRTDDIIEYQGTPLFALDINSEQTTYFEDEMSPKVLLLLFILSLILFIFYLSTYISGFNELYGVLILILGIGLIRMGMISVSFPMDFINWDLFDSKIYVSSGINPTLGDLFFNVLSLVIITGYVFSRRVSITQWVNSKTQNAPIWILKMALFAISLWLLALNYRVVFDILSNSQISLDISKSLEISFLRTVAYMVIVLTGIFYFLCVHTIHRIIFSSNPPGITAILKIAIPAIIIFVAMEMMYHEVIWLALIIQLIYFFLIYLYNLPHALSRLRFDSILYLVITIIVLSSIWSVSVYKAYEDKEKISKEKFETKLLLDRDLESEFLFKEIMTRIQSDVSINARIINPQSSPHSIVERIKRSFLSGYFNQYHVYINLYNKNGEALEPDVSTDQITDLRRQIEHSMSSTDFEDIFYEGNISTTGRRRYVCLIDLQRYGIVTGHVVLDFQLKKQASHSVYPELLLDNKGLEKKEFDYAVYTKNVLVYNSGSFNYAADFSPDWLTEKSILEDGIERNGFHHLAVKGFNKMLIVTSTVYSNWSIASNFSFFFLLFSCVAIMMLAIRYIVRADRSSSMNFSTKILLYLGAAFAIPLALVGAGILNTINESYRKEIDKSYEKNIVALSEVLIEVMERFESDQINRELLSAEVSRIADNSRNDLTVYDPEGSLISSSQPTIFTRGLLSNNINPRALYSIRDKNRNKVILQESIGSLNYKTSYVAVRSHHDGHLLGILGSPYFSSKNHLNRQSTEVFNNIINISTIIFILSMGLTYVGVSRLTNPIILIAARLKKLAFEGQNQPLEWHAEDEIGVLVDEYNSMLTKLEKSKKELARNEKEAAWREMAKQVAHEIKNPLTPMKLTLQHMDRTVDKDSPTKRTVHTLLGQIDTLDQIVTSFSHFAKMPDPERVEFDLKLELQNIVALHPDREIITNIADENFLVHGDKKLFGRIFNNIILNAFQAMSNIENAKMIIDLSSENENLLLSFSDNGPGIDEDIKDKVFTPNFSTKDSGSGIGLAVAKRGIEHAGGSIWFTSNEMKGTTFYIQLPLIS